MEIVYGTENLVALFQIKVRPVQAQLGSTRAEEGFRAGMFDRNGRLDHVRVNAVGIAIDLVQK